MADVWFRTSALLVCASVACATGPVSTICIAPHERGLEYLRLAASASEQDARRLCDQAEQSCRLSLEYEPRFAHAENCLGIVEITCHRQFEAAAEHFRRALAIDDDFAEAHNNLGVTFQRRAMPDYETAADEYRAALEIDPGYQDARENLAVALMHLRRWDEARDHLIRLLEINPLRAEARHSLGVIGLETDHLDDAEYHLKRCLELEPEHPECNFELGNVYLRSERFDEAIQAYAAAIRHPSAIDIAARQNLRLAFERAALKDGAILQHVDYCAEQPGDAACHFDLGSIWAERGILEKAVAEWTIASHLAPDYCPAHYQLAMAADRVLDATATEAHCRETIDCVRRTGDRRVPVDECVELVRQIARE